MGCFSLIIQDDVTALIIAVFYGYSYIVEVLIRFKSDVNLQTKVSVVTDCSVCGAYVCCADTSLVSMINHGIKFICVSVNLQTLICNDGINAQCTLWHTEKSKIKLVAISNVRDSTFCSIKF